MRISKVTAAIAAAVAAAGTMGSATAFADEAGVTTTSSQIGGQAKLVDGNVVQAWTISDLKPSTDTIPYDVQGTLWEATATDEAIQGSVTPIISNLNARAADGQNYRVLFQVATPQGVNPATLAQGEKTSGKVYFDVTGEKPTSVVYSTGGHDVATWTASAPVQQPRTAPAPARTQPAPAVAAPASPAPAAPAPTPAPAATPAPVASAPAPVGAGNRASDLPVPAGTQGAPLPEGSQGTPLPPGSQGTPLQPGTESAPLPQGSQGTPVPAGTEGQPPLPGSQGTPLAPGSQGTPLPEGSQGTPPPPGSQGTPLPEGAAPTTTTVPTTVPAANQGTPQP
ncbi:MPT63 family protein [Mycolicibacterium mageritense]|nr:immunogenic protein MPT63 [Mycolicibacterium mageritense]